MRTAPRRCRRSVSSSAILALALDIEIARLDAPTRREFGQIHAGFHVWIEPPSSENQWPANRFRWRNQRPPEPLSTGLFPRLTWCRSDANGGRIRSSKGGDFRNFRRRRRAIRPARDSWSRTSIPASTAAAIRSSALPANPLKSGPICSARGTISWPPNCCGGRNPRPTGGASRCAWPETTAGTANSPRPSRAATCSRSKPGPTSSPPGAKRLLLKREAGHVVDA